MWPVPGNYQISTPWGRRGMMWSCGKNSQGGVHTGCDFACPKGTPIFAPIAGVIRHRAYGPAFGPYQFAISPDADEPFGSGEVFFAHGLNRLPDGTRVKAGDRISEVGNLGNATGFHLHFEFHPSKKNAWGCDVHADPAPVLAWRPSGSTQPAPAPDSWRYPADTKVFGKYLKWHGHELNSDQKSISIGAWQDMLNHHSLEGGANLPITEAWYELTAKETAKCQAQHVPPADTPLESVFVGPKQFAHVKAATSAPYVWEQSNHEPAPSPTPPEAPYPPPVMAAGAAWDPVPKTGGGYFLGLRTFSGTAKKITLHTTESTGKPNWAAQQAGIPHLTVDLASGRIWQHLSFDMAAYTLKGADHSPNADSGVNVQIELTTRRGDYPSQPLTTQACLLR